MARKLILASHGRFASGINSSLKLICGSIAEIITIDCYTTEDFDLSKTVDEIMTKYSEQEIIVITDIFGGSVNNEFLRYINYPGFYLVAGLNLPFLIELVTKLEVADNVEIAIQQALDSAKQSIQYCNTVINQEIEEEEF